MTKNPDFSQESKHPNKIICGVDEAGRGPLAGPVVSCALWFHKIPEAKILAGINDSKKLTAKKRQDALSLIHSHCIFGVGIVDHVTIDKINILEATKISMLKAISELNSKLSQANLSPTQICLIDGNISPMKNQKCPELAQNSFITICKGDEISASIAAASIIAKTTRDEIMAKLSLQFPEYGWQQNAGYGTKAHLDAMKKFGISEFHRKTFKPVKELIS